jgi:hypothetical protein
MLVLQIACGILVAWAAIAAAPIVVGLVLGALARVTVAGLNPRSVIPPFWRNPNVRSRGPTPFWATALICGGALTALVVSVALGVA